MPSNAETLGLAALLLLASGGTATAEQYRQSGLASWYGEELAGARTASGARFDPAGLSAAHRSLPLGSFVEVTALDTGRSVLVLVNDRGPHRRDRLIDLSRGAAKALGMNGRPFTRVRVRALAPGEVERVRLATKVAALPVTSVHDARLPSPVPSLKPGHRYVLQVATFSNEGRARALARAIDAAAVPSGKLWRVQIGPMKASDVQAARDAVAERGYGDVHILPASTNTENR